MTHDTLATNLLIKLKTVTANSKALSRDVDEEYSYPLFLNLNYYFMSRRGADALLDATNHILGFSSFKGRVSNENAFEIAYSALGLIFQGSSDYEVKNELRRAIARTENSIKLWRVYFVVSGVEIDTSFEYGPHKIRRLKDEDIQELSNAVDVALANSITDDSIRANRQRMFEQKLTELNDKTVLVLEVNAERRQAHQLASEQASVILSIFGYCLLLSTFPQRIPTIGLQEVNVDNWSRTFMISSDMREVSIKSDRINQTPLRIDSELEGKIAGQNFPSLWEMYTSISKSDIEQLLCDSMEEFWISYCDANMRSKHVGYMQVLERFLSPDGHAQISKTVAEGFALLVTQDVSGRKQWFKILKKQYAIRSEIVHGSDTLPKSEDIEILEKAALLFIRLVRSRLDSWKKIQDIRNEIEDLRFS